MMYIRPDDEWQDVLLFLVCILYIYITLYMNTVAGC